MKYDKLRDKYREEKRVLVTLENQGKHKEADCSLRKLSELKLDMVKIERGVVKKLQ